MSNIHCTFGAYSGSQVGHAPGMLRKQHAGMEGLPACLYCLCAIKQ